MSELTIVIFIAAVVIGSIAGHLIAKTIISRRRPIWKYEDPLPKPSKEAMTQVYCTDCGTALQSLRQGNGYDGVTGQARYRYVRRCPKAGEGLVNCSQRAKVSGVPGLHSHEDVEETNLACPACLDVMLDNGAIDTESASKLYAQAGVVLDRSNDPMFQATMAKFPTFGSYISSGNP